jgi:spoIIIJ-associated protein
MEGESSPMEGDSVEIRGRTVDEAIHAALDQLGVTRDDVEIEVLSEGRSGVFGVGSQDARVRVTIIGEEYDTEEDEEGPLRPPQEQYEEVEDEEEEGEEEELGPQPVAVSEEETEAAREALERMLDLLEFPNLVTVRTIQRDRGMTNVVLDVAGDDVGLLIGRHGETLASVQFLLNACLGQKMPRNTRIIVDVEHYRDRREQSLRSIAMRTADRVRRERRAVTLQPMPPNERRIIHLTLQASPYVSTESTGEGPERRVVVSPKAGPPPRRPSYGYRRG